ncbi:hypothetical protein NL676_006657 [Syzygium grande]|nr:hypothetical protein NL676_006657 [Syzygium grande]
MATRCQSYVTTVSSRSPSGGHGQEFKARATMSRSAKFKWPLPRELEAELETQAPEVTLSSGFEVELHGQDGHEPWA